MRKIIMLVLMVCSLGMIACSDDKEEFMSEPIVKEIMSDTSTMDEFDTVKYAYDYLVENVSYEVTDNCHTVYGALKEGKAVCDGFALAFKELVNYKGISCEVLYGKDGETNHAWNIVYLNGEWYYIDTVLEYFLTIDIPHEFIPEYNDITLPAMAPSNTWIYERLYGECLVTTDIEEACDYFIDGGKVVVFDCKILRDDFDRIMNEKIQDINISLEITSEKNIYIAS